MLTSTFCLSVCTLESYLLVRYSVYCRWDPFHRISKRMIMINRHWDAVFWEVFFFCHFSLQVFLLICLYECQNFIIHMKKISELQPLHTDNALSNTQVSYHPCSKYSFKNQQILCFLSFSQPILKNVLCFSCLQSSFLFQFYWKEISMLLLFQRSYLFQSFRNSAGF